MPAGCISLNHRYKVTNQERIISLIGFEASAAAIAGAMIDNGIVDDDDYDVENKELIRKAAIEVLEGLYVSSVSEGGYSITYDRAAIRDRIGQLNGGGRTVRAVFVW